MRSFCKQAIVRLLIEGPSRRPRPERQAWGKACQVSDNALDDVLAAYSTLAAVGAPECLRQLADIPNFVEVVVPFCLFSVCALPSNGIILIRTMLAGNTGTCHQPLGLAVRAVHFSFVTSCTSRASTCNQDRNMARLSGCMCRCNRRVDGFAQPGDSAAGHD